MATTSGFDPAFAHLAKIGADLRGTSSQSRPRADQLGTAIQCLPACLHLFAVALLDQTRAGPSKGAYHMDMICQQVSDYVISALQTTDTRCPTWCIDCFGNCSTLLLAVDQAWRDPSILSAVLCFRVAQKLVRTPGVEVVHVAEGIAGIALMRTRDLMHDIVDFSPAYCDGTSHKKRPESSRRQSDLGPLSAKIGRSSLGEPLDPSHLPVAASRGRSVPQSTVSGFHGASPTTGIRVQRALSEPLETFRPERVGAGAPSSGRSFDRTQHLSRAASREAAGGTMPTSRSKLDRVSDMSSTDSAGVVHAWVARCGYARAAVARVLVCLEQADLPGSWVSRCATAARKSWPRLPVCANARLVACAIAVASPGVLDLLHWQQTVAAETLSRAQRASPRSGIHERVARPLDRARPILGLLQESSRFVATRCDAAEVSYLWGLRPPATVNSKSSSYGAATGAASPGQGPLQSLFRPLTISLASRLLLVTSSGEVESVAIALLEGGILVFGTEQGHRAPSQLWTPAPRPTLASKLNRRPVQTHGVGTASDSWIKNADIAGRVAFNSSLASISMLDGRPENPDKDGWAVHFQAEDCQAMALEPSANQGSARTQFSSWGIIGGNSIGLVACSAPEKTAALELSKLLPDRASTPIICQGVERSMILLCRGQAEANSWSLAIKAEMVGACAAGTKLPLPAPILVPRALWPLRSVLLPGIDKVSAQRESAVEPMPPADANVFACDLCGRLAPGHGAPPHVPMLLIPDHTTNAWPCSCCTQCLSRMALEDDCDEDVGARDFGARLVLLQNRVGSNHCPSRCRFAASMAFGVSRDQATAWLDEAERTVISSGARGQAVPSPPGNSLARAVLYTISCGLRVRLKSDATVVELHRPDLASTDSPADTTSSEPQGLSSSDEVHWKKWFMPGPDRHAFLQGELRRGARRYCLLEEALCLRLRAVRLDPSVQISKLALEQLSTLWRRTGLLRGDFEAAGPARPVADDAAHLKIPASANTPNGQHSSASAPQSNHLHVLRWRYDSYNRVTRKRVCLAPGTRVHVVEPHRTAALVAQGRVPACPDPMSIESYVLVSVAQMRGVHAASSYHAAPASTTSLTIGLHEVRPLGPGRVEVRDASITEESPSGAGSMLANPSLVRRQQAGHSGGDAKLVDAELVWVPLDFLRSQGSSLAVSPADLSGLGWDASAQFAAYEQSGVATYTATDWGQDERASNTSTQAGRSLEVPIQEGKSATTFASATPVPSTDEDDSESPDLDHKGDAVDFDLARGSAAAFEWD